MDESVRECVDRLLDQREKFFCGKDIRTYSPLTLAFIGDAVFSLYIRTIVAGRGNTAPGKLHEECSGLVQAKAQSQMIRGGNERLQTGKECPGAQPGETCDHVGIPPCHGAGGFVWLSLPDGTE